MYARAHPNMIYFTIIAYPETYFNTIFNKICPPYILRDLCPLVHNMPVFRGFFADFCRFSLAFRIVFQTHICIICNSIASDTTAAPYFPFFSKSAASLYRLFASRRKIPDTFAVLCAYLSFRQINLRTRSRVFLFQG